MKDSERSLDDEGSKMKGDKRSLDEGSKMKDDKRSLDDGRSQLKDGGGSLDDKRSSMKDGGGSLDGKRELEEREEEELFMMESENGSIYGEEPLWVVKCAECGRIKPLRSVVCRDCCQYPIFHVPSYSRPDATDPS